MNPPNDMGGEGNPLTTGHGIMVFAMMMAKAASGKINV